MGLPTITDLKKKGTKRTSKILASEKGLMERSSINQKHLNSYMLNVFMPTLDVE